MTTQNDLVCCASELGFVKDIGVIEVLQILALLSLEPFCSAELCYLQRGTFKYARKKLPLNTL